MRSSITVLCSNPADKLLVHCGTGQTAECRPSDPLLVPAGRLNMVSWNVERRDQGCPGDPLPDYASDDKYE